MIAPEDRLRIARMARLRYDERSARWLLVYPERGLSLSATAADILQLCDGARTVSEVTEALTARYSAAPGGLGKDVTAFLQLMADRGLLETA